MFSLLPLTGSAPYFSFRRALWETYAWKLLFSFLHPTQILLLCDLTVTECPGFTAIVTVTAACVSVLLTVIFYNETYAPNKQEAL